jgi:hypothetical protein
MVGIAVVVVWFARLVGRVLIVWFARVVIVGSAVVAVVWFVIVVIIVGFAVVVVRVARLVIVVVAFADIVLVALVVIRGGAAEQRRRIGPGAEPQRNAGLSHPDVAIGQAAHAGARPRAREA